jgi:hypothetical protein
MLSVINKLPVINKRVTLMIPSYGHRYFVGESEYVDENEGRLYLSMR